MNVRPIAAALALCVLGACTAAGDPSLPDSPPYLVGVVTERIAPSAVLIEGQPGPGYAEDRAKTGVSPRTTLLWRSGERARWEDLVVGRPVSLWITGTVLDTDPVQVEARVIVLEPEP